MTADSLNLEILRVTPPEGVVLDPFMGSGTAGQVAVRHSCEFIGIELSEDYIQLALGRFKQQVLF